MRPPPSSERENAELQASYRLLEVSPDASPVEIRKAYLFLVNIWHPDRFVHEPNVQDRVEEKLKAINEAYQSHQGCSAPRRAASGRRPAAPSRGEHLGNDAHRAGMAGPREAPDLEADSPEAGRGHRLEQRREPERAHRGDPGFPGSGPDRSRVRRRLARAGPRPRAARRDGRGHEGASRKWCGSTPTTHGLGRGGRRPGRARRLPGRGRGSSARRPESGPTPRSSSVSGRPMPSSTRRRKRAAPSAKRWPGIPISPRPGAASGSSAPSPGPMARWSPKRRSAAFGNAVRLKPDLAEAWCGRGTTLLGLQRYDEALDALREAVRLKPDFADAWYSLAVAGALLQPAGRAAVDARGLRPAEAPEPRLRLAVQGPAPYHLRLSLLGAGLVAQRR